MYFYSRPCGRGDKDLPHCVACLAFISTHAPAGGATSLRRSQIKSFILFLLTPLREGRPGCWLCPPVSPNFYSRPCGRGDVNDATPGIYSLISTHAPAGGATASRISERARRKFLLTPLREGRRLPAASMASCVFCISTHAPAGGATSLMAAADIDGTISTHAPAGGATNRSNHQNR